MLQPVALAQQIILFAPILFQLYTGLRLSKALPPTGKILNVVAGITDLLILFSLFITPKDTGLGGLVFVYFGLIAWVIICSVAVGNVFVWITVWRKKKPTFMSYMLTISFLLYIVFARLVMRLIGSLLFLVWN